MPHVNLKYIARKKIDKLQGHTVTPLISHTFDLFFESIVSVAWHLFYLLFYCVMSLYRTNPELYFSLISENMSAGFWCKDWRYCVKYIYMGSAEYRIQKWIVDSAKYAKILQFQNLGFLPPPSPPLHCIVESLLPFYLFWF